MPVATTDYRLLLTSLNILSLTIVYGVQLRADRHSGGCNVVLRGELRSYDMHVARFSSRRDVAIMQPPHIALRMLKQVN